MAERRFACTLDGLAIAMTLVSWVTSLGAAAIILVVVGLTLPLLAAPFLLIFVGVPVWTMLVAPRGYLVGPTGLTVLRLVGGRVVPFAAIAGARRVARSDLGWLWRTFGSGGAHGYFGRYRSRRLGPLVLEATRRDRWVLVRRRDGQPNLVLSPDDPDGFLAALEAAHRSTPL